MTDITTAALSRQVGLLDELNIIANNMANAGTVGFKKEASVFTEYVRAQGSEPSVSQAALRARYPVLTAGAYTETSGTYDLAIVGEGFFAVETDNGIRLTRNGQFQRDAEGTLITHEGHAVLDEGGGAITIPAEANAIQIGRDGTVSIDGVAQAQLGVFTASPESLIREGGNLWQPTKGYQFIEAPVVRQGYLEQSNVNPVLEMARLVEAQRLFEAGQNLLEQDHRRQEQMIRQLGGTQ